MVSGVNLASVLPARERTSTRLPMKRAGKASAAGKAEKVIAGTSPVRRGTCTSSITTATSPAPSAPSAGQKRKKPKTE